MQSALSADRLAAEIAGFYVGPGAQESAALT